MLPVKNSYGFISYRRLFTDDFSEIITVEAFFNLTLLLSAVNLLWKKVKQTPLS